MALLFVLASCAAAKPASTPFPGPSKTSALSQVPSGALRSELELDWVVRDRGTGHAQRTREHLWLTLDVSETGAVVLRARAESKTQARFLGDYTTPGHNQVQSQDTVRSDAWRGGFEVVEGEISLRLEVPGANRKEEPIEQRFRCERITDDPSGEDYLHCTPSKRFEGTPFTDPMPPYLRAPLVFARNGHLRAHVSGDHERQRIDVSFSP